jgi:hypothetical protein
LEAVNATSGKLRIQVVGLAVNPQNRDSSWPSSLAGKSSILRYCPFRNLEASFSTAALIEGSSAKPALIKGSSATTPLIETHGHRHDLLFLQSIDVRPDYAVRDPIHLKEPHLRRGPN